MKINPILACDGYKLGHRVQYPQNTDLVFCNYTARSTRRTNTKKVCFAGLQPFVKHFLIHVWNTEFFQKPLEEVTAKFQRQIRAYLNTQDVDVSHIEELHKLGYLPIEIWSLPEGTEHELKIPSMVIWNTDKRFFWLPNFLETAISTNLWGICTSTTTAHNYKKLFTKYALETVGNTDFVPWQGHDFSFRGMFGSEAACMSGAGHLFSFCGTDTIPAIGYLEDYYNADVEKEIVGGSVNATEHSVSCSIILDFVQKVRGTRDNLTEDELMSLADIEYVKYLITEVYPTGIVSIVADSFDYWNTITNTARVLKDVILARNGKVVFRPDTGDPVKVVTGDVFITADVTYDSLRTAVKEKTAIYSKGSYIEVKDVNNNSAHSNTISKKIDNPTPEQKGSIEVLWEIFGGTVSEKGYKILDPHVGLIYGDSITYERAEAICERLKLKGFASTNLVYGIGSFTYQYVTRDTDGYAIKATYIEIDNKSLNIFKAPKGAEFKKSAKGLTAVYRSEDGEFYLKDEATWDDIKHCSFVPVFRNGELLKDYTLQEVRSNLASYL